MPQHLSKYDPNQRPANRVNIRREMKAAIDARRAAEAMQKMLEEAERRRQEVIGCRTPFSPKSLSRLFADRQCSVPDGVIHYMVTHMERNFTTAYRLVAEIDRAALSTKKPVSLAIVKLVMMPDNGVLEFDFKHGKKEI